MALRQQNALSEDVSAGKCTVLDGKSELTTREMYPNRCERAKIMWNAVVWLNGPYGAMMYPGSSKYKLYWMKVAELAKRCGDEALEAEATANAQMPEPAMM